MSGARKPASAELRPGFDQALEGLVASSAAWRDESLLAWLRGAELGHTYLSALAGTRDPLGLVELNLQFANEWFDGLAKTMQGVRRLQDRAEAPLLHPVAEASGRTGRTKGAAR